MCPLLHCVRAVSAQIALLFQRTCCCWNDVQAALQAWHQHKAEYFRLDVVQAMSAAAEAIHTCRYIRIVDPFKASYGVDRPLYAVMQLAQTSMRSELGKMSLDSTFEERDALNEKIVRVRFYTHLQGNIAQ